MRHPVEPVSVALVVGTQLTALGHGPVLLTGEGEPAVAGRTPLNNLTPFTVDVGFLASSYRRARPVGRVAESGPVDR